MPVVLGLHAFGHEAGACLVAPDGLRALSEERLSRVKYDGAFPKKAIEWVLEASGVGDLEKVDLVVYDLLERAGPRVIENLRQLGYLGEIRALRHHEAHAASAFFVSPFEEATVFTIDAGGTREGEEGPGVQPSARQLDHPMRREVQAVFYGQGHDIRTLRRTVVAPPWTINPGVFYGLASEFLGFGQMGAGKVMGLSAFGGKDVHFRKPFFEDIAEDPLARCPTKDPLQESVLHSYLPTVFGGTPPRKRHEQIDARYRDIAAYVQAECQRAVVSFLRNLASSAPSTNLCMAGGFALNAISNTAILGQTPFKSLFVQPAATDAGIPLGCALWGYHVVLGQERRFEMRTADLGGAYTIHEIQRAIGERSGIIVRRIDAIEHKAAEELAAGKIIGWLQGRSEFGPRALGHRSIFADPRNVRSVSRLNEEIKFRESFRPYAPMVLEEAAKKYFDLPESSPFMLLIAPVRQEWRSKLPAVTHVDGTARIQTVSEGDEPGLFRLLKEFERQSGCPVLLNTSFNRAGEPIIESPTDALDVFLATDLEALVMEDFWIEKEHVYE